MPATPVTPEQDEDTPGSGFVFWTEQVLLGCIVLAFLPVLGNGFVNWDDDLNFLNNFNYRGITPSSLRWAWTTFHLGVYQPLAWLLLELEYSAWGMNPFGYHLTSLLLHLVNSVVLYRLAILLLRGRPHDRLATGDASVRVASALAAGFFAVNPLRVEVVAWASCQPYLPSALFALLTVWAYLRACHSVGRPRWGYLVAANLLFAASLLCKAAASCLPLILLILDVYPIRRLPTDPRRWLGRRSIPVFFEKLSLVVLSLIFMGIAVWAKHSANTLAPISRAREDWSSRLAQVGYSAWFYLSRSVIPFGLRAFYPLPDRMGLGEWPFLLRAVACLIATVVTLLLRRRWPGLLAAWVSYLVLLLPASGLIRIGNQLVADRYSYIPMLALTVPLALAFAQAPRLPRPLTISLVVLVLAALLGSVALTRRLCLTWRDQESLWLHAYTHGSAGSAEVNEGLALAYMQRGHWDRSISHLLKSTEIREEELRSDPDSFALRSQLGATLSNLGLAYYNLGRYREALAYLKRAIRHQEIAHSINTPNVFSREYLCIHHFDAACALRRLRRADEALGHLDAARALCEKLAREYPRTAAFRIELGNIHHETGLSHRDLGHRREALAALERACAIRLDLARSSPDEERLHKDLEDSYNEIRSLQIRPMDDR